MCKREVELMSGRGRVLIVDDEPLVARALVRTLKGQHEVSVANNGQEAMEMLEAGQRFDLILCDLQMPRMTGVDLFMNLDQLAPDQADRMVFLTGNRAHPMSRLIPADRLMEKTMGCAEITDLAMRMVTAAMAA